MTVTLRPYQEQLLTDVRDAWAGGAQNVVMRLDTGGGKTVCLAKLVSENQGASCLLVHRGELVIQISTTLARYGVSHDVIGATATRKAVARAHVEEFGRCFYVPGARVAVASVDTLIRATGLEAWASQVTLWVCDEAHHLVGVCEATGNKWWKAISRFTHPHVRGLMPTATPGRADGRGLGRPPTGDGVADVMVDGPPMRWLIEQGFLTEYQIVCPPSDMRVLDEPGASGDWSPTQLRAAAVKSHIVGDVVQHYQRWAPGKLGITFCTDVETAIETTAAFNAAGVRAETLTGKTDDYVRRDILRRYRNREILQLVTVDIVSEGFDLPAIEVASMARPTQSLGLYMQQFGRALRPMPGKTHAIIIDHVSNTIRHGGPPDRPRVWTLDRRDKRAKSVSTAIPLRVCTRPESLDWPVGCYQPYSREHRACPHCAYEPVPAGRSGPEAVDGDLALMDAETLARLRGDVARVDATEAEEEARLVAAGCPSVGVGRNVRLHRERQAAQTLLREAMARWAGPLHAQGYTDSRLQRLFYLTYGVDVASARALGATDAERLRLRVDGAVNGG